MLDHLELTLQMTESHRPTVWVLGTEAESSGRATSALNFHPSSLPIRYSGAGVAGSSELPDVGPGNQTQVPWESSERRAEPSLQPLHLSSCFQGRDGGLSVEEQTPDRAGMIWRPEKEPRARSGLRE